MVEKLGEIDGLKINVPDGAFYMFPNASEFIGRTTPNGEVMESIDDLCMYILNTGHVSVVTGSAFGNPNCFRLSYAASEENLIEACSRIKRCLGELV